MSKSKIVRDFNSVNEAEIYENLGAELRAVLGLKVKRSNGRIDTQWGDKSLEGIGRTVARIVHEHISIIASHNCKEN